MRFRGPDGFGITSKKGETAMKNHGTVSTITGNYVEFQAAVLRALPRDIDRKFVLEWTQSGKSLSRVLREALLESGRFSDLSYSIEVNYDETIEGVIKGGTYDWYHPSISSGNFPSEESGIDTIEVEFIYFNRIISLEDAFLEIDRMGYRSLDIREFLALGKDPTRIQKKFPIVALGSCQRSESPRGGYERVIACENSSLKSKLDLFWEKDTWNEDCRFAVTRRHPGW